MNTDANLHVSFIFSKIDRAIELQVYILLVHFKKITRIAQIWP